VQQQKCSRETAEIFNEILWVGSEGLVHWCSRIMKGGKGALAGPERGHDEKKQEMLQ
jgi:hypothetical protein